MSVETGYEDRLTTIYQGDVREVLRALPDESVHCVITSPPYFGLRSYDTDSLVWGGESSCEHEWGREARTKKGVGTGRSTLMMDGRPDDVRQRLQAFQVGVQTVDVSQGAFCTRCGAWLGSLGLEPTPELFVEHLVEVFREVRRVLRSDGTVWCNLGDSYAANRSYQVRDNKHVDVGDHAAARVPDGLKPKDLCMIPARVALALQADGWWLRDDIVWAKGASFCSSWSGSVMPESVVDRPSRSHEYVFLLAKSPKYFYDIDAVREKFVTPGAERNTALPVWQEGRERKKTAMVGDVQNRTYSGVVANRPKDYYGNPGGRNLRSVWAVATQPMTDAHFAVMPEALVRPCVLAGTSERGCCAQRGAPWERVARRQSMVTVPSARRAGYAGASTTGTARTATSGTMTVAPSSVTVGWRPACRCRGQRGRTVPCVVLDPFGGSGTTAVVARELGRRAVLADLKP